MLREGNLMMFQEDIQMSNFVPNEQDVANYSHSIISFLPQQDDHHTLVEPEQVQQEATHFIDRNTHKEYPNSN